MRREPRLIDRCRQWLYSLSLVAYSVLGFGVQAVVFAGLYSLHAYSDPRFILPFRALVVTSLVVAAIGVITLASGEHSSRKKFAGAHDRAAYHRAVETTELPAKGVPEHWREQMLTEIDEKSKAYFGMAALPIAVTLTIASAAASGGGWVLILEAAAIYLVLAAALVYTLWRAKNVKKMYPATKNRIRESVS